MRSSILSIIFCLLLVAISSHPQALHPELTYANPAPILNSQHLVGAPLQVVPGTKTILTYNANGTAQLPGVLTCSNTDGSCPQGDIKAQTAHRFASIVYDYFATHHGYYSYDGQNVPMISTINYTDTLTIAWAKYNPAQVVYENNTAGGVWGTYLNSLDLAAHEWSHIYIMKLANLGPNGQPGALNESYADIFATLIEFEYEPTQANWLMFEDSWTPKIEGDALRDLANPAGGANGIFNPDDPMADSIFGGTPEHMDHYIDISHWIYRGAIHKNSTIHSRAAYLLAEGGTAGGMYIHGIGREAMGKIAFRALSEYLPSFATFLDSRNAWMHACADLFGADHTNCISTQNAFAAVGIGDSNYHHVYLPFVNTATLAFTDTSTGVSAVSGKGIYGQVTQDGIPQAGISVSLYYCGANCSIIRSTSTDTNGVYQLTNVVSLPPFFADNHWYYYIGYKNNSPTNNGRLSEWKCNPIYEYSFGENLHACDFNIADVQIHTPSSDTTNPVPMPINFSWSQRRENSFYAVVFNRVSRSFASIVRNKPGYTLTLASDPGFRADGTTLYSWQVYVFTSQGTGISYETRVNRFSVAQQHLENYDTSPLQPEFLQEIQYADR